MPPIRDLKEEADLQKRIQEREAEQTGVIDDEEAFEDASEVAQRRSQEFNFATAALGAPRIGNWDEQVPTMFGQATSSRTGFPAYSSTAPKTEQEEGNNNEDPNNGRPQPQEQQQQQAVHEQATIPLRVDTAAKFMMQEYNKMDKWKGANKDSSLADLWIKRVLRLSNAMHQEQEQNLDMIQGFMDKSAERDCGSTYERHQRRSTTEQGARSLRL
eukprot:GHVU01206664.1.p1 GENE.GHVU01206664.1~~GHVU01206664.1.p1  ORF type:complete len:215 (+),score=40.08 GHVU01206664.1:152-796(+)